MRDSVQQTCQELSERYPGVAALWWYRYRLARAGGDPTAAWEHLKRARMLEPGDVIYRAVSLPLAAEALSEAEREKELADTWEGRKDAPAPICLFYSLVQLRLARPELGEERLKRALEMARLGLLRRDARALERRALHAIQLHIQEHLAGQIPDIHDILYRAGLGELLLTSSQPIGKGTRLEELLLEEERWEIEDHRQAA